MKPYWLFAACCAWVWLAAGLAQGQTMPMHKYYGRGPDVSPPYWEVPDLTEPAEHAPPSKLDITNKARNESAYDDTPMRNGAPLRGKQIGRHQNFSMPRTYTDHSTNIVNKSATDPHNSARFLQNAPTISSTAPRYNTSLRYWEISRYRSAMQRYMDSRARTQPK